MASEAVKSGANPDGVGEAISAMVAGPVGAGLSALLGAAILGRPSRHEVFDRHLGPRLAESGVELTGTQIARDEDGPLWVVTVRTRSGALRTLHARVPAGPPAFAPATALDVAERIVRHLG